MLNMQNVYSIRLHLYTLLFELFHNMSINILMMIMMIVIPIGNTIADWN